MARSFQSPELFAAMTVRGQLLAAGDHWEATGYLTGLVRPGGRELGEEASWAVEHLGIGADLDEDVNRLPYGRRRLVALARAVACAPSMILLDEPAAGLDVEERGELRGIIRSLAADKGMGVLLVEHEIGRAHVCTPVNNAHLVCRLLTDKTQNQIA